MAESMPKDLMRQRRDLPPNGLSSLGTGEIILAIYPAPLMRSPGFLFLSLRRRRQVSRDGKLTGQRQSHTDATLPTDDTPTTPRVGAMRVIYLLLAFFILTGIGANCRTPAVQATSNCASSPTMTDCDDRTVPDAGD
jgi:hypothetical protein